MGKCIIKLDGKFVHWSSVTDGPESPLLPEELFKKYWQDEYGRSGVIDYEDLMELAREKGCSARGYTVAEILSNNRAGKDDKKLTKEQIIEAYTCTDPKEFEEWSRGRDKAFAKMAIEFGPEGRKQKAAKK